LNRLAQQAATDWTDGEALPHPALHDLLRSTTREVHERLHSHRGLAAVKAGRIGRTHYVALLRRLHGFHRPFERAAGLAAGSARGRTGWLEADLGAFGFDRAMCAAIPQCPAFPNRASPRYFLGACYVVEGSALGGRGLARQLDGLLGIGVMEGRRFFNGHGMTTGTVWREYLARLSAAPQDCVAQAEVIEGATATFATFEQWLEGWDDGDD
jgi:heme oxygenase (biliverdin-IX-beta and delta-forming)